MAYCDSDYADCLDTIRSCTLALSAGAALFSRQLLHPQWKLNTWLPLQLSRKHCGFGRCCQCLALLRVLYHCTVTIKVSSSFLSILLPPSAASILMCTTILCVSALRVMKCTWCMSPLHASLLIALPKSCQSASSNSVFLALACKCPHKCDTAVLPEWECVGRQAQHYFVLVCCLCIDAGMLGEIPVKLRAWGTYVCTE